MAGSKVIFFASNRPINASALSLSVLRVHTLRIEQGKTLSSVQGFFYQEEQLLCLKNSLAVHLQLAQGKTRSTHYDALPFRGIQSYLSR
jgi:hypothetical protein